MQHLERRLAESIGNKAGDVLAGILLILMLALWVSLAYLPLPLI